MADQTAHWKVMRFENGPRAIELADHIRRNPATVDVPEGYSFVREWPLYEHEHDAERYG